MVSGSQVVEQTQLAGAGQEHGLAWNCSMQCIQNQAGACVATAVVCTAVEVDNLQVEAQGCMTQLADNSASQFCHAALNVH